jgi:RNA polymerase sigma-70 factor (ECF subfamily)
MTLLQGARQDQSDAWQRLVQLYSRRMYRWCRMAGLQPADAANVVQESFAAVARKLGDFRRDRPGATFRGWLRRIVQNKICDHHRQVGRRADVAVGGSDAHQLLVNTATNLPQSNPKPDEAFAIGDAIVMSNGRAGEIVRRVREEVGERDWHLFWRTAVDGQPAPEVAEEFNVSANAVRIVKMRVLKRIRGYFAEASP